MAEWNNPENGSSIGSYGFALQALSEGLANALRLGWVTEDEAKAEFRSHVKLLQDRRNHKLRALELRAEADEVEGEEDIDF